MYIILYYIMLLYVYIHIYMYTWYDLAIHRQTWRDEGTRSASEGPTS